MNIDFDAIEPVAAELTPRKVTRQTGPNPFLDKGWLQRSFETGKAEQVTVGGTWEEYTIAKGDQAGQVATKLVGDAAQVVYLLRQAAVKLGLGVRIETVKAKGRNMVTVKYLGQQRKQKRTAE